MTARRLFALAMIVSMMLVGFNVGFSNRAEAAFIEQVPTMGLSSSFYPEDVKWDHTGTMAVVVGFDTMGGPNAYAYFADNETWIPLDGYYSGQTLYSVDYYSEKGNGTGNGTEPPSPPEILVVDANGYSDGQTLVTYWSIENASCSPVVTIWDIFGKWGAPQGHPGATDMAGYDVVVWVCSYNMWAPTGDCFGPLDETNVAGYLEGGGNFFMANAIVSSYFSYGSGTPYDYVSGDFAYDYLGLDGITNPTFPSEDYVQEAAGDAVFSGIGIGNFDWMKYSWNPPGTPPGQCDGIDVIGSAFPCMNVFNPPPWDNSGVRYDQGTYRTMFFGFPIEPLSTGYRDELMNRAIGWLAPSGGGGGGSVLVVDADYHEEGISDYYVWSLENNSAIVTVWDVYMSGGFNQGKPTTSDMDPYDLVVWVPSRDMDGYYGVGDAFTTTDEGQVANYLDGDGNFFLSSTCWLAYGPAAPFSPGDFQYDYMAMSDWLDGQWYDDEVSGVPGDSAFDGYASGALDWARAGWGGPPSFSPLYCDRLSEAWAGAGCMDIWYLPGADLGGVKNDAGTYKTMFMGFPFEVLQQVDADEFWNRTLGWFNINVTGSGGPSPLGAGGHAPSVTTDTTPDQANQNSTNTIFWDVGSDTGDPWAQSFVPSLDNIVKAEFYMYSMGTCSDHFLIEICPDAGGFPASMNITHGWISPIQIPIYPAMDWVECWFEDGGAALTPGDTYWIKCDRRGYTFQQGWLADMDKQYNPGIAIEDIPPWSGELTYDWMFRTFANVTTGVPCATIGADRDNGIFEESWDESNGAGMVLRAGQNNMGEIRRSFIHFDIASHIPAGSVIDHVELKMYCNRSSGGSQDVTLRRVQVNWGEGTSDDGGTNSGDPATPGDTTWHYCFYPTTTWFSDGGSYAGVSAMRTIPLEGHFYTWGTTSWMVSDVQGWLDNPGSNYGWAIVADESMMGRVKQFSSRECDNQTKRPELKVYYTPPSGQVTVSIHPVKDNTIYDDMPPPEWSNGYGDNLFTGMDAMGRLKRSLIKFDIANNIPAGAVISNVNLTMYCDRTTVGAHTVRLHQVYTEWGEASSHAIGQEGSPAPAELGDATWNFRILNTNNWVAPGGDYNSTGAAAQMVNSAGQYYTWSSGVMRTNVQNWLNNPSSNHGWIVVGNEGGPVTSKRFSSRSNRTYDQRPVLEVTYTYSGGGNGTGNGTLNNTIGTFWLCGNNPGLPNNGATVYKLEPKHNLTLQKVSTFPQYGSHIEFTAIAVDDTGNPLCAGYWFTEMYYHDGTNWNLVPDSMGMMSGYAITGIDYNPNDLRFYAVGYDMGGNGALFYTDAGLSGSGTCYRDQSTFPGAHGQFNSIAWNHYRDYGMVVGYGGVYLVDPYSGGSSLNWTAKEEFTINIFYDCDWDTDGWNEAGIVGTNNSGDAVYWRYYHTNPVVMFGGSRSPPSQFDCCAFKPPSSPKWLFIPYNAGGWRINILENDQSTGISLDAGFPHIFNVDMWRQGDQFQTSVLNTQVDPDTVYTFYVQGNYTQNRVDHWNDVGLMLSSWYDNGATGTPSNPLDPTWTTEDHRTRQFNLTYDVSSGNSNMVYPQGFPGEFTIHSTYEDPGLYGPDNSWHRLYINVSFGPQTYQADSAFPNGPPSGANYWDKNFALNDAWSWDLNFTLYDTTSPGARNITYEEYGIKEALSISVLGNPNGAAPPGTANYLLSDPSNITYSSNTNYWINISIPNLYKDGDIMSPYWIPATNLMLQNTHPSATGSNSDIPMPAGVPGAGVDICAWGISGPVVPMSPVMNGTVSAGPSSDFIEFWYGVPDFTTIYWWVTIPPGQAEGLYQATITITVES